MPGRTRLVCRLRVIALLAMVGVVTSSAVAAEEQRGSGSQEPKLNIQMVKTGLFLISGGGANSLMRLSANGEILVDGKRSQNYAPLKSQVRTISRITDMPVRVVILTNHHEDHSGTNAKFLAAGAQIIAQENAARSLATYHTSSEKIAPPTITYANDYTLRLGGVVRIGYCRGRDLRCGRLIGCQVACYVLLGDDLRASR